MISAKNEALENDKIQELHAKICQSLNSYLSDVSCTLNEGKFARKRYRCIMWSAAHTLGKFRKDLEPCFADFAWKRTLRDLSCFDQPIHPPAIFCRVWVSKSENFTKLSRQKLLDETENLTADFGIPPPTPQRFTKSAFCTFPKDDRIYSGAFALLFLGKTDQRPN